MTAIAFIPAKGHSGRVPDKNTKLLGGHPLVFWTIRTAVNTPRVDEVWVVTDSHEIGAIARQCHVNVLFRPENLSAADVSATDVTCWARKELGLEGDDTAVVQLLPTSPFREKVHINEALDLWERDPRAAVVSVRAVSNAAMRYERANGWLDCLVAPGWRGAMAALGVSTQWSDLPPTYISTGGIQIASASTLRAFGRFHIPKTRAIVLDSIAGLDIDTEQDWAIAEGIVK